MQSPVYILDGGTAEKQRISAMVLLLFPFVVAAASVTSMPIFNWVVWIAGVLLAVGFVAGVLRSTGAIPKELFLFYAFAGWSTLGVINAVAPELLLSKLFTVLQLGVLVGIV